jgi:hypothetical protein
MKIPYKSKLSGIRSLTERNKKFHKLSPRSQRQEIALDALKLLKAKKIKAAGKQNFLGLKESWYWSTNMMLLREESKTPEELQKKLCNLPTGCSVCARGGMMLSQIRLGNKVKPIEGIDSGRYGRIKAFKLSDFREMEDLYEHGSYSSEFKNNSKKMLANIFCNVISNGNFIRKDNTNYLKQWRINL